ncbi:MAG: amino acid kinase family protein [Candidatus Freyarchaeota archaeon]
MESFDFILKVGGSLSKNKSALKKLFKELAKLSETHKMLVIPGGGHFADEVRKIHDKFNISEDVSHWMAVFAMDQMGFFFSDLSPKNIVVDNLEDAAQMGPGLVPILIPAKMMLDNDPLPHSWDVTSDSIAAYIAHITGTKKILILTDVDGVYTSDPKSSRDAELILEISADELAKKNTNTCVDKTFPILVSQYGLECVVLNGKHPERLVQALKNKKVKGTIIHGKPVQKILSESLTNPGERKLA